MLVIDFASLAQDHAQAHTPRNFTREACIDMNLAFAQALLDARHKGLETSFTLGPIRDFSPLVPKHFPAVIKYSGMGSSAAQCAEEAPKGEAMPSKNHYRHAGAP